ncbi:MAG: DUF433 domain-containing protein [Desulfobacterales bacterium]|nr:MAG: DUF433 domain-containing protein [Desulfobacterales bacterium]
MRALRTMRFKYTMRAYLSTKNVPLSFEDLLDAYPNLKREDILAALLYAAAYLGNELNLSKASRY